jgi:AcrR family transcriptional regulator
VIRDAENNTAAENEAVTAAAAASQQERSLRTRQQLIDAARKTFARDGFDRARLHDIAAMAGKTRGAFYSHFQNKEDVFFAIFEQDSARDQLSALKRLRRATTKEGRLKAFAEHLVSIITDKERMLLGLEFKMYALRTERGQQRLADLHTDMCIRGKDKEFELLLPELYAKKGKAARRVNVALLSSLIDGMGLNSMFNPAGLDSATLNKQALAWVKAIISK